MHFVSYIPQNLLAGSRFPTRLEVRRYARSCAGDAIEFLLEKQYPYREAAYEVGVSIEVDSSQQITAIGFSTATRAVAIRIDPNGPRRVSKPEYARNDAHFLRLLSGKRCFNSRNAPKGEEDRYMNAFVLVGFEFPKAALLIRRYLGVPSVRGIDLGTLVTPNALAPWNAGRMVRARVKQDARPETINRLWDSRTDDEAFFMRAWISHIIARCCEAELRSALAVDTARISTKELEVLEWMVDEEFRIHQLRPNEARNEFSMIRTREDGRLELENERYKTRIRRSECQEVVLTLADGSVHRTRARGVQGRATTLGHVRLSGAVEDVRVVGRQDLTNSERSSNALLLGVLQGVKTFHSSPFIRLFWFPSWKKFKPPEDTARLNPAVVEAVVRVANLNESQAKVVRMIERNDRCVLVHGPPGTGKTTTIAAAARIWDLHNCPVWIIAHSNVAVKNIALALHKREVDFKILVSKEFYEEWHEHLYNNIRQNLIRSDELPTSPGDMERLIGHSCIILSTLGMLSNPALDERGVFREVPFERLIVDEASQIRIFEYLHLFEKFGMLEKIFFFGDPKQLPPHNYDQIPGMKTVFDLDHLQCRLLLDTQYRLPIALASFVSDSMYAGRLRSVHEDSSPECVLFVDVPSPHGAEHKASTSWTNDGEVRTVVHLVRMYYKTRDFAIIVPYDGQRAAIQNVLKADGLPWEEVYTIDSFQGNERQYIICSMVRTERPGFLTSRNRLNVMLTRCKKGLVVVANRSFLEGRHGSDILVAQLAAAWRRLYGDKGTWVDWTLIAEGKAAVPGFAAPRPEGSFFKRSAGTSSYAASLASRDVQGSRQPAVSKRYMGSGGGFDPSKLFARPAPRAVPSTTAPKKAPPPSSHPMPWIDPRRPHPANPFSMFDDDLVSWGSDATLFEVGWKDESAHLVDSAHRSPAEESYAPSVYTFPESSFPSLDSMSSEDDARLRTKITQASGVWAAANGRGSWSSVASLSQNSTRGAPSVSTRSAAGPCTHASSSKGMNSYPPFLGSSTSSLTSPTSKLGGSSVLSLAGIRNPDLDDGGWTRVERRRGKGRKNVNSIPTATQVVHTKAPTKKRGGYRYWVGLD